MSYFKKNDQAFICAVCGSTVGTLGYTSRNHCNKCLSSLHVDNLPGDRENPCGGILRPVSAEKNAKGYVIIFQCEKCGEIRRNKVAEDDDIALVISLTARPFSESAVKRKI
ncbi:MAG: RNHCP domain-containing protein [Clostridiales bacterium]|jgi:putative ribosome biogenesis GTPase RsgA|nr:RNHCP domain-containing protein [Clostridiales bacterium]